LLKAEERYLINRLEIKYGDIDDLHPTILNFYALKEILTKHEDEEIKKLARSIPFKEFYKTPYWKIIRAYLLHTKKQCAICRSREFLAVHHLTYKHFGLEYKYLNDLAVLCEYCHAKVHRTKKEMKKLKNLLKKGLVYAKETNDTSSDLGFRAGYEPVAGAV
jgi:5-methylcytosine-specific restriction endonuclease McrA